jgi:hypothetical protein
MGVRICAALNLLKIYANILQVRGEIIIAVILVILSVGEFFVWYSEILWHKDESNSDTHNWSPPR